MCFRDRYDTVTEAFKGMMTFCPRAFLFKVRPLRAGSDQEPAVRLCVQFYLAISCERSDSYR